MKTDFEKNEKYKIICDPWNAVVVEVTIDKIEVASGYTVVPVQRKERKDKC